MRISPPRLLILIALLLVVLIELRTALAFFDVEITVNQLVGLGVVTMGALLIWALWPADGASDPE
ncbi:CbaC protein [Halovivax gelatinilyticus]|uniref:CbaC protein n=1 Tax=Halovivax gelatinilyticus TaxID=2961597 RepID=UPI0020CA6599|nr:CbaC protein [Halovivax gelatinilyticus]